MHFDILIEDQSGKILIESIVRKLLDPENNTFTVHCYKGIGRVPPHLNENSHPRQRFLLTQLPKLLNGLGKTHAGYGIGYPACVVIVCDLDRKDHDDFTNELAGVLNACQSKPETRFCLAVEEIEAWLLGDAAAVKIAYPKAKDAILQGYIQDSICGTWEVLADAVHPGGAAALKQTGSYSEIGRQKCEWAAAIGPHMNPFENVSPSFHRLRDSITQLGN